MNYRWFISRTVRHATHMWKHVRNMLAAQRDVLSPQAIENVSEAVSQLRDATRKSLTKAELRKEMERLEEVANKWLKPYPHAVYRENVEVFLVAIAVAMAIRTFFVQPFKIPTGSMQPTLYGVTSTPDYTQCYHYSRPEDRRRCHEVITAELQQQGELKFPTGLERVRDWFAGISYIDIKAKADGALERINNPVGIRIFNFWQTLVIGGKTHLILFPPDYGQSDLGKRNGLELGQKFRQGETVVHMKIQSGDHLFVDRLTYNFRKPTRGEIAVFQTAGIEMLPQDQFYIKRLVALGGERVQMGNDRHLIIDGRRLDAATPRFENVYSFDPGMPPSDSHYSGHVNDLVCRQVIGRTGLSPLFSDETEVQVVPPDHYMVMGDNTMNSLDSRTWGSFPGTNIIGKQFFVYWPLTKRFGWGNR